MTIQVFGSDCQNCKKLLEQTKQAVSELKINTDVEYSTEIEKIIELGVMSSPVLVVDNKVVMSGQVPGVEKIKEILTKGTAIESEQEDDCGCCSCGRC